MRKGLIVMLSLTIAAYIGWQNRIEIMVANTPTLKRTVNPVAPNLPTQWLDWATSHQPKTRRTPT